MRRIFVALMMLLSLCFTSCKQETDAMQTALKFRTQLVEAGGCTFTAEAEADYGDKLYQFTLDCEYDGTDGFLTVTAPQEVSGISAAVSGETSELSFDGSILEYGELANGYIAPLSVPWLLGSAWKEDYISAAGTDGERASITYLKGYHDEELEIKTYFRGDIPWLAEVSSTGKRALSVTISDFSFCMND